MTWDKIMPARAVIRNIGLVPKAKALALFESATNILQAVHPCLQEMSRDREIVLCSLTYLIAHVPTRSAQDEKTHQPCIWHTQRR